MSILPLLCFQIGHYAQDGLKRNRCYSCKHFKYFYKECKKGKTPCFDYKHCTEF